MFCQKWLRLSCEVDECKPLAAGGGERAGDDGRPGEREEHVRRRVRGVHGYAGLPDAAGPDADAASGVPFPSHLPVVTAAVAVVACGSWPDDDAVSPFQLNCQPSCDGCGSYASCGLGPDTAPPVYSSSTPERFHVRMSYPIICVV